MHKLSRILEGWDGYQTSLQRAAAPLTSEQLNWRPAPDRRTTGELLRHICMGRITWLDRMKAPGIEPVAARVPKWVYDEDGTRAVAEEAVPADAPASLNEWLALSWQPIHRLLEEWTVDDLFETQEIFDYVVSRQWMIWRILSHDTHHGGQLAALLALQGIEAPDLREQGGHIVIPPRKSA